MARPNPGFAQRRLQQQFGMRPQSDFNQIADGVDAPPLPHQRRSPTCALLSPALGRKRGTDE
jgi:hypothetical protein